MSMINATLIVQAVNFWLTYIVLHKFLFKPFVATIIRKEAAMKVMLDGLTEKENLIVRLQDEKKKSLEEFKRYLKKRYVAPTPQFSPIASITMYEQGAQALAELTDQAAKILEEKAGHGYGA